jgi:16S rRNA (uracil1498-N3)-methyltransferase
MQQCGRTNHMEFDIYDSVDEFIKLYPDTKVFDFCDKTLTNTKGFEHVLVGCEGGFSENEREKLKDFRKIGLNTDLILKSETAIVTISSKLLI